MGNLNRLPLSVARGVAKRGIMVSAIALAAALSVGTAQAQSSAPVPAPTPAPAPVPNCGTDGSGKPVPINFDARQLTQAISIQNCWSADVTNADLYYMNDLYTRWVVEEMEPEGPSVRDYAAEKYGWLERIFVGHSRSAVMSVRIKMRDPDVEFTIPLVTADYNGKPGQGEAFNTMITRSDMSLPDFRLSPNSSVSVEASARLTNDVDVHSAGIVLGALKDTLSIAAPAGSLLTAVNKDQVQRVSNAYDTALSKLLSSSFAESATEGRVISEWYPTAAIIVAVDVPEKVRTQGGPRTLRFRLRMACPRLSVFDSTTVCETGLETNGSDNMRTLINSPFHKPGGHDVTQVTGRPGFTSATYKAAVSGMAERVSAHQVLDFKLGLGKSVRQYLAEQEWFISLSKKMVQPPDSVATKADVIANAAPPAPGESDVAAKKVATDVAKDAKVQDTTAAAAEFCEAVVDKLFTAGLSKLDAEIGLWAIATGLPDFASTRSVFQLAPACRQHLPGAGWAYF